MNGRQVARHLGSQPPRVDEWTSGEQSVDHAHQLASRKHLRLLMGIVRRDLVFPGVEGAKCRVAHTDTAIRFDQVIAQVVIPRTGQRPVIGVEGPGLIGGRQVPAYFVQASSDENRVTGPTSATIPALKTDTIPGMDVNVWGMAACSRAMGLSSWQIGVSRLRIVSQRMAKPRWRTRVSSRCSRKARCTK